MSSSSGVQKRGSASTVRVRATAFAFRIEDEDLEYGVYLLVDRLLTKWNCIGVRLVSEKKEAVLVG